jgi:hypothetical protein
MSDRILRLAPRIERPIPLRREFDLSGFLESFMPPELIIACHKWARIIQRGESRRANPATEEH